MWCPVSSLLLKNWRPKKLISDLSELGCAWVQTNLALLLFQGYDWSGYSQIRSDTSWHMWEARWPYGYIVLDSGSNVPGSGTVCCDLGQDTLLSRCLSPPRCINGTGDNAGCNPAMDWHPIQGGVEILLVASCYRNRDRFRPNGTYLARKQTLHFFTSWHLQEELTIDFYEIGIFLV